MTRFTIETDATIGAAQTIASEALGRVETPLQAGRLGAEFTLGVIDALTVARALRGAGHKAWVEGDVAGALQAYRDAREAMPDLVRLAGEDGMSQVSIAKMSGLSRQWVAKIIADGE